MTPHECAGRALFLIEHPHVAETTWPLLDEPTRAWWISRATPIADAVRRAL